MVDCKNVVEKITVAVLLGSIGYAVTVMAVQAAIELVITEVKRRLPT